MLFLAQEYAKLKKTKVIAHRITGKEITFVLESGPKLTLTESQLKLAIETLSPKETDGVGTVADSDPQPSAPSETAPKARKIKKES